MLESSLYKTIVFSKSSLVVIFVECEFWYHNTEEFLSHFYSIDDIISDPWDLVGVSCLLRSCPRRDAESRAPRRPNGQQCHRLEVKPCIAHFGAYTQESWLFYWEYYCWGIGRPSRMSSFRRTVGMLPIAVLVTAISGLAPISRSPTVPIGVISTICTAIRC